MKNIFFILVIFLLANCGKSKTVLICGDHVCVNKAEAKQYFEENLTIEVSVVNKKIKEELDLVELNLTQNEKGERRVILKSKNQTSNKLKTLSNEEIKIIKKKVKENKNNKIAKKIVNNDNLNKKKEIKEKKIKNDRSVESLKKTKSNNDELSKIGVNKKYGNVIDVCTILEKCNIDEISKYLIEQGKKKSFPDITIRQ